MISCEKGEVFGLTIYPSYSGYCVNDHCTLPQTSDSVIEPALFARCRPDEDFTDDVQSTKAEIIESSRRPEIAFVLTENGLVRNAVVSRGSGSKSLDLKVLRMVTSRHYRPTRCGTCQVFVAPPVNLKKYGVSGPN